MKSEMTKDLQLVVIPETVIEFLALQLWSKNYKKGKKTSCLLIAPLDDNFDAEKLRMAILHLSGIGHRHDPSTCDGCKAARRIQSELTGMFYGAEK